VGGGLLGRVVCGWFCTEIDGWEGYEVLGNFWKAIDDYANAYEWGKKRR